MSGGGFGVFFVLFVVLIIAVAIFGYLANQRRQKAFAAWAAQHGYTYTDRDDRYDDMPWGSPFGVGHSRAALDVLTASVNGRPVLCFTYRYKTTSSNGKTSQTQTHLFSIFSTRLPNALPNLRVGREGLLSSLARLVGIHDIEFESEQFNRQFKVKSDDRKFASDVVNPQMMQFLLDGTAPGFSIIGADLVLVDGGRLQLEQVEPTVAYLDAVVAHIPRFVWDAR